MKKGEEIKYAITKEVVYRHSLVGWLEFWGIEREDWDKFMEAGEKALDGEDGEE